MFCGKIQYHIVNCIPSPSISVLLVLLVRRTKLDKKNSKEQVNSIAKKKKEKGAHA